MCNTQVSFVRGGGEAHGEELVAALRGHGHEAELIQLPFWGHPGRNLVSHSLAWRLVDVTESMGSPIDVVVALRFPAYLVRHPAKVVWLLHQHRAAYELWDTEFDDLQQYPDDPEALRRFIYEADNRAFDEAKSIFANSATVAHRLATFNSVSAKPLYHPPPRHDDFRAGPFGDYVLAPGRLEPIKRQDLLIEAISKTSPGIRCLIAGEGSFEPQLRRRVSELGLEDRVEFLGHVSDHDLIDHYANAGCVFYGPYQEDYGYVTLEAFLSTKPVVTLSDSGGPLEFVSHGVNGLVSQPDPTELATAIELVMGDHELAKRLGAVGARTYKDHDISWTNVVETLLS